MVRMVDTMKNPAAVALGKLTVKTVRKYSPAEKKRRSEALKARWAAIKAMQANFAKHQ